VIEWGAPPAEDMSDVGSLTDDYVVPPFSVLDTRQGYWQERRRRWLSLGITSEMGRSAEAFEVATMRDGTVVGASGGLRRGELDTSPQMVAMKPSADRTTYLEGMRSGEGRELVPGKGNWRSSDGVYARGNGVSSMGAGAGNTAAAAAPGTSIFDPVLCELAYRWWAPAGGTILDPFAGGSVRGIVAAKLGHPYIGIDLSGRQLEANREQAAALLGPNDPVPTWIEGDSTDLDLLIGSSVKVDLVFSCPPYYDLEVYSDDPADLSAKGTYADFVEGYRAIMRAAVGHLATGGFAAMVVSEIRGKDGFYKGLVPDTIAALEDAGARYYNEAILVNSAGSLPLRAGQYMAAGRKLGRCHQNVIVGRKGTGSTREWSAERADPPDPQTALWGEEEDA